MVRAKLIAALGALAASTLVQAAAPARHVLAEAQVLDLAKKAIAIRSVRGPGNKTGEVAQLFRNALLDAGWADGDIEITPVDDTAYFIATWPGRDLSLGAIVLSAHMDVVEAKPEDWQRDPFTPVVENGYLFGRGASDTKFDAALALSSVIELRREGYKPRRTIVIEFSGDEETTMKTSEIVADKLRAAELVLNVDGSGGTLDEKTGKPAYWSWQGAEKIYADFQLEVTNQGGHSSEPRPENAISELATAVERIGAYRFTPELSPLTKAYFERAAAFESDAGLAAAMRAFAANPLDTDAVATLRASFVYIGRIGTTCVPTMIDGGHALNALPQRATANINCRIFPGHAPKDVMAELEKVADMPQVKFTDVTEGSVATDASPMRADFVNAATKAIRAAYPGVAIIPSQASGASDSMWFRRVGVASYGASPSMIKDSDEFAHGLNERTPLSNIGPGIIYYLSLLKDLTK